MLLKGEDVAARGVASSLLRNVGLNLWGLGATIVGLQVLLGLYPSLWKLQCVIKLAFSTLTLTQIVMREPLPIDAQPRATVSEPHHQTSPGKLSSRLNLNPETTHRAAGCSGHPASENADDLDHKPVRWQPIVLVRDACGFGCLLCAGGLRMLERLSASSRCQHSGGAQDVPFSEALAAQCKRPLHCGVPMQVDNG